MITMSTRPLRILVVDDDPAMVGAITALVGTEGHQVITAYDGLTAVKRFREEHPDLVLLDLAMPGPDGFNVAGQMRAVGPGPDPRRLGRERRGGQGPRARPRRGRLPDQAVRQGRAAGPDRGGHAPRRPQRRAGLDRRRAARPPATSCSSRAVTRRGSATTSLTLTPTEFRLLEALVRAGGDIVPHLQLARAGWPAETDPDLLWLKPHLARLRSKVAAAGGPQVVAVRGVGYRIVVDGRARAPEPARSAGPTRASDRDGDRAAAERRARRRRRRPGSHARRARRAD